MCVHAAASLLSFLAIPHTLPHPQSLIIKWLTPSASGKKAIQEAAAAIAERLLPKLVKQ